MKRSSSLDSGTLNLVVKKVIGYSDRACNSLSLDNFQTRNKRDGKKHYSVFRVCEGASVDISEIVLLCIDARQLTDIQNDRQVHALPGSINACLKMTFS